MMPKRSIFVLCSLFLLPETFLKPKKSNKDNNSIIATTLSYIINVYFIFNNKLPSAT